MQQQEIEHSIFYLSEIASKEGIWLPRISLSTVFAPQARIVVDFSHYYGIDMPHFE